MTAKMLTCLWLHADLEEAAQFSADTFPGSRIGDVMRAPGDYPAGQKGKVLTIEMTILERPFLLLGDGPAQGSTPAVSFQVATADQAETDRYWDALTSDGGSESQCGWCRDRYGITWQITPRRLIEFMQQGGDAAARAFAAMMPMRRIDIATLERAVAGG